MNFIAISASHSGELDVVGRRIAERIVQYLIDNSTVAGRCIDESFGNTLRNIDARGPTAEESAIFLGGSVENSAQEAMFCRKHKLKKSILREI